MFFTLPAAQQQQCQHDLHNHQDDRRPEQSTHAVLQRRGPDYPQLGKNGDWTDTDGKT